MTKITMNYTTYDLDYYYADLKRLPCLSRKERQHPVTGMSEAHISLTIPQETQFKHLLIEGYLPFATHLAITLFPPSLYQRLLPDLIGAVNLAVLEATLRCYLSSTLSLDAYVAAYVRGAIKQTIVKDDLLNIPFRRGSVQEKRARSSNSTHNTVSRVWMSSWNGLRPMRSKNPRSSPSFPPRQHRAQMETLLSYLSPRAQVIFRLRYGVSDDNEHRHATAEIVRALGLDRRLILTTERDTVTRLRALVAGKATLGKKNGKPCILYPDAHNRYTSTPEQEASMLHTYREFQAQGVIVTGRLLAKEAGVSVGRALMFLRQHAPLTVARPIEPTERARLTLHDGDPFTGNQDTLYTLFYEYYRGYTIYSTPEGRCCMQGKHGCIRLRGKFVCFPDVEDAKTLIKRFRADGYTSYDSVERYLPEWEFICLSRHEQQRTPKLSRPLQRVS